MATASEDPTVVRRRGLWTDPTFRALAISTGTSALGNGIFAAISFLYYTHVLSHPAILAGAVLTATGFLAILGSVPLGRVIDRSDPSLANGVLLILQGVAVASLILGSTTAAFVALAGTAALASKLRLAARGALIAIAFTDERRLPVRAYMRTISNIGIGLGSGGAALVVASNNQAVFRYTLGVVGLLCILAAWPMPMLLMVRM